MKYNRIGTEKNLQAGSTYDLLLVKVKGVYPEGQITFGLYDTPMKITGLQKVAQHFLRVLLSSKGSDPFYPKKGTLFPSVQVGSNITSNNSELISDIVEAVEDASQQVKTMLNNEGADLESALDSVKVLGVTPTEEGWILVLYMLTLAGEGAEISLPSPSFGIDPVEIVDYPVIPVTSPGGGGGGITEVTVVPTAAFSLTPSSGDYPLIVSFTDSSTGAPTSWNWNFGDGNTSSIQSPTHTYTSAGTYSPSLVVANSAGSNSVSHSLTVTVPSSGPGFNITFEEYGADATYSGKTITSSTYAAYHVIFDSHTTVYRAGTGPGSIATMPTPVGGLAVAAVGYPYPVVMTFDRSTDILPGTLIFDLCTSSFTISVTAYDYDDYSVGRNVGPYHLAVEMGWLLDQTLDLSELGYIDRIEFQGTGFFTLKNIRFIPA